MLNTSNVLLENRYAKVYQLDENPHALVCEVLVSYIPEQNFRELFLQIGEVVKKNKDVIHKLIFDKRNLTTFHQASMVWYHVEWKPEMIKYGLRSYRKILPTDTLFKKSVEIGRNKIAQEHPEFEWEKYDIQYCENVEEALEK
jgi:O-methyltransferase involved in polyketide biosynthesis